MHPNDGRVMSNFILQALRGREITVCGDGTQTRSFCCFDDMIEGLLRQARYCQPLIRCCASIMENEIVCRYMCRICQVNLHVGASNRFS